MTPHTLRQFYDDYKIEPISTKEAFKEIEKSGETIFEGQTIYGRFRVFKTQEHHYIYVQRLGYTQMFVDNQSNYYEGIYKLVLSIGSAMLALFLLIYIMILKKLYPLKRLHKQIEQFADGNLDIKIDNQGGDEIGKIAQSFDKAIGHIRQLISSKNLFMRNMMHELKTPITKGRIVVEMIEDGNNKKTLIRAFERMNQLIGELAYIERLTTQSFQPQLKKVNINDILERSLTLLLVTKEKVTIKTDNNLITTDAKLLSLALKNLNDNAIKYSENSHATIISNNKSIKVLSKGKSLENPLEYYLEPFTQEEKRQSGFGLGLYIVNNIIQRLDYTLHYYYKDSSNVFEIQINK